MIGCSASPDHFPDITKKVGTEPNAPVFRWTPDANQIGTHELVFTASDGQLTDSDTVVITVLPADSNLYYDGRLHWLMAKESGGWINLVDLARLTCPEGSE